MDLTYLPKGVRFIGMGGIGGALVEATCRYLAYTVSNELPIDDKVSVTLVDGDSYEIRNRERQSCTVDHHGMNKAEVWKERLDSLFDGVLEFDTFTDYITEENAGEVIRDGDLVLLSLDNHKSRKIIAEFCDTLDNITLVSGGNELTDGNVQVFVKRDGEKVTANLYEYHPEIADAQDKHPNELGCADLLVTHPQLISMNFTIASLMLNAVYLLTTMDMENVWGEVYVDIVQGASAASERTPVEVAEVAEAD